MVAEPIIETKGLTRSYEGVAAVSDLNLRVDAGDSFGLLGPNGAGKTTTILMLLGLTEPTSGSTLVCGFDPKREPIQVKRLVGYLPEQVGFYDTLTARENLDFIANLNNISAAKAKQKIDELLEIVGISSVAERPVRTFSRGMRQRLGIAQALLKEPKLVFLDEPTSGLDPEGINQVLTLIGGLPKRGTTVVMSSHRLYEVQRVCNRIAIFAKGKMVIEGYLDELGRQAFAGGRYRIEVETERPTPALVTAIKAIPGVNRVEVRENHLLVNAEKDLRNQVAKVIVQNDFPLSQIKSEEFSLDEIYMKYFKEGEK